MPLVQEGHTKAERQGAEAGPPRLIAHLPLEGPEPQEIKEGIVAKMAQGFAYIEVYQVKLGRAHRREPGEQPFQ